jgi:hypothetical protein
VTTSLKQRLVAWALFEAVAHNHKNAIHFFPEPVYDPRGVAGIADAK